MALLGYLFEVSLPPGAVRSLGAGLNRLLPPLRRYLDHPGLGAGYQAMDESYVSAEVEHGRARCALPAHIAADFLYVHHVGDAQSIQDERRDILIGGRHGIQDDAPVPVVGDTAAHAWVNGQDPFHLAAFRSQA